MFCSLGKKNFIKFQELQNNLIPFFFTTVIKNGFEKEGKKKFNY